MFTSTFKKTDSGIYGNAFEMAVKFALKRKDYGWLSPTGRCDLRYGKCYDTKQNGSPILYSEHYKTYIKGSSRVIYATHIAYEIVEETEETITIFVDLANTDMWVVDRKDFLNYLLNTPGMAKDNPSRGQVNIQTLYNYKKNAYHGKKGRLMESWLDENQLADDTIIEDILDGFYASL